MLLPLRGANEAGKRYSDENILELLHEIAA
jgi:hypothetical protein